MITALPARDAIIGFLRGRIPSRFFRDGFLDMLLRYYLAAFLRGRCPGATFSIKYPSIEEHTALCLKYSRDSAFREIEIVSGEMCIKYPLSLYAAADFGE